MLHVGDGWVQIVWFAVLFGFGFSAGSALWKLLIRLCEFVVSKLSHT